MLGPWIKVNWKWSKRRWQDILGISELKWMGMGEFKRPFHLLLWARIPQKQWSSPKCSTWVPSQKWQHALSSFPRQTIQHPSNPSLCPNHWCWRRWSWSLLWRPIRHSKTNTKKKDVPFIIRDCNVKVGSQEIPGVTGKFGLGVQNEAGQNRILSREHTGRDRRGRDDSLR